MVVTSWINLQYYGSTTDREKLGAGNKTLHNVAGGVGVIEGAGGDLRIGLPIQSIHDGTNWQHLPQRLNVVIEAPESEVLKILEKHEHIRNLCENNWIALFIMDNNGKVTKKYNQKQQWEQLAQQYKTEKLMNV